MFMIGDWLHFANGMCIHNAFIVCIGFGSLSCDNIIQILRLKNKLNFKC